jgi:hypothetical protein
MESLISLSLTSPYPDFLHQLETYPETQTVVSKTLLPYKPKEYM